MWHVKRISVEWEGEQVALGKLTLLPLSTNIAVSRLDFPVKRYFDSTT
jgi:hypothetical protein